MLLHFIFISVVVCTVEISEFHSVFLCLSRLLENLSAVSLDACDNFSFPSVVVSFSMPQIRGLCGHLKGGYINHPSCINCCGCYRFHGCSVCNFWSDATMALLSRHQLYSDRPMGKKEAKEKKLRNSASRKSSSSRPGLERTESADQTWSAADGPDDDASVLSRSSSRGERVRGSTQVSKHHSHGTPGPMALTSQATQRFTPARPLTRDLAGKYGDPADTQVNFAALTLLTVRTPHRAILPWVRYHRIDPLGLNQYAGWNDPLLATPVIKPG